MSRSFRPVKEIWNMHSSCFVEPEDLIISLHDLAARVDTASDEHEYGDNKAVWLGDGKKVLDYMEADERFNAASFKESLEEQGIAINQNDLSALIDNMRSLIKQWRSSIASLRGSLGLTSGCGVLALSRALSFPRFVGTLVVDSVGVGMAAFGFLNPLLAAFIHVTSELAFILNSTRLLPRSSEAGQ